MSEKFSLKAIAKFKLPKRYSYQIDVDNSGRVHACYSYLQTVPNFANMNISFLDLMYFMNWHLEEAAPV